MSKCFVLMLGQGQYEDYTSTPVHVYLDNEKAKAEAKRLNALPSVESYIEMRWAAEATNHYLKYDFPAFSENPYKGLKPVYDKSRERDKEYNLEYLKDKRIYQDLIFEWNEKFKVTEREIAAITQKAYNDWYKTITDEEISENSKGYDHPHYYVVETDLDE